MTGMDRIGRCPLMSPGPLNPKVEVGRNQPRISPRGPARLFALARRKIGDVAHTLGALRGGEEDVQRIGVSHRSIVAPRDALAVGSQQ